VYQNISFEYGHMRSRHLYGAVTGTLSAIGLSANNVINLKDTSDSVVIRFQLFIQL